MSAWPHYDPTLLLGKKRGKRGVNPSGHLCRCAGDVCKVLLVRMGSASRLTAPSLLTPFDMAPDYL